MQLSPINQLMTDMAARSKERVAAMNTARAAKHYGIPESWVAHYRKTELESRG